MRSESKSQHSSPKQLRIPSKAIQELVLLLFLMGTSLFLFRVFPIDYQILHSFYTPGQEDPWPVASEPIPRFLYQYASMFSIAMGITGLSLFVTSFRKNRSHSNRWFGIFLLSALLLGPAIVVNAIFKDHWGRPRPRQTEYFGGNQPYHQLLEKGTNQEKETYKSFPCGHCSVGFIFIAFWFWWRRRRPFLGSFALIFTLILGFALGYARIAAGGHHPSDVLWALFICWFVCWILYYPVLGLAKFERIQLQ